MLLEGTNSVTCYCCCDCFQDYWVPWNVSAFWEDCYQRGPDAYRWVSTISWDNAPKEAQQKHPAPALYGCKESSQTASQQHINAVYICNVSPRRDWYIFIPLLTGRWRKITVFFFRDSRFPDGVSLRAVEEIVQWMRVCWDTKRQRHGKLSRPLVSLLCVVKRSQ